MIIYIKGDLLKSQCNIIAHGVNCVGGFGSGVAGQIAKTFPYVKVKYLQQFEEQRWTLGNIQEVFIGNNQFIYNCATQNEYYPRNKVHCDYPAVEKCMKALKDVCLKSNYSLAIPKIGCGLAGGDWNIVEKIIENVFGDDMDIYVYEL